MNCCKIYTYLHFTNGLKSNIILVANFVIFFRKKNDIWKKQF